MKILVGLSNGLRSDNVPYQMFIVDADAIQPVKQEWVEVSAAGLSSCSNIRVNLGKYKSITQNPLEYLEAEFDLNKLVNTPANNFDFQIINVYKDEAENPVLYRSINASGEIKMHHISELPYKKRFSIYGANIDNLPSFVKPSPVKEAYEWWANKDNIKMHKRPSRFIYETFDTYDDMPVQLLYHYLTGVKGFQLGYHTITDLNEKYTESRKLHEYFLFKGTANLKLRESIVTEESEALEEVAIFGNKDPYPDSRKLGYYGATMSMICNRKNYPVIDIYNRPTTEANFDQEGIEVTIDITDGNIGVYNKYEEANCISPDWRLGENGNFFGVTLASLVIEKLRGLSKIFQDEKERVEFGHWSAQNTHEWFQVMSFALSTQYYSKELRNKLTNILNDYQMLFSNKLTEMIEKISAKDTLETMKWAGENVEKMLKDVSFVKEDYSIQKSTITSEQKENLFTFKRNTFDLPDWLQIYSSETIEKLGGANYLNQFIATRGEESAELFLSIWAEKLENDRKYGISNVEETPLNDPVVDQLEDSFEIEEKPKNKKTTNEEK